MPMTWIKHHPGVDLGYLPSFLLEEDPRPAKDQINERYTFGGFRPAKGNGFTLHADNSFSYPGDPRQHPLAQTQLRDELIVLYPYDFVAIIQPDRSFEIARID